MTTIALAYYYVEENKKMNNFISEHENQSFTATKWKYWRTTLRVCFWLSRGKDSFSTFFFASFLGNKKFV